MVGKKTKIIYCITKSSLGGAQKYVYDLATSLPKDFYDIHVLLGTDGVLARKLETAQIRTIILGDLFRNIHLFKDFLALIKLIKTFKKEKPDIIHLNSSKMGLLGAIAGRYSGIPKIIFTGHGWAFNEERNKFQKKIIYWLHLLTVTLAHKTIAVSEKTRKQILNKFNKQKIIVVKNGLGKTDYLEQGLAREQILKKIGQGDSLALEGVSLSDQLWLGTISELHQNKGLEYLIEAMHLLKISTTNKVNLPIIIIIGEGEQRQKLEQKINQYGLKKLVFLIGRIDEAEKYLKAFDIFTLTSITEALPYAILEAGQAGLPIIASNVGGIPEIIDDMTNGILVRPKESAEVKKALDFLLNNANKRHILGQNIQKRILTEFSKEKMVKETLAVYMEK